ncbi:MAG TPA: CpsB/CapC family capsule biosynthesis tyrosine phosphatase [Gemmatimonadales bacterium]|jgi:tyrosine-protein phosphatase YwqE
MNLPSDASPGLVDLHSHLVPAVDDGSTSIEESRSSLAGLFTEGVRLVVTTPHLLVPQLADARAVDHVLALHRREFDRLAEAVAGEPGLPTIGLGQEIWAPDAGAMRRVADRADIGLSGTRAMLVEFGFDLQGQHTDVIEAAMAAGREVIIAHPERYRYVAGQDPLDLMRRWRDMGALLQVNAGSFSGYYRGSSPASRDLAWDMVEAGLVDLVATDHHGTRRAGVSLREAYEELTSRGEGALAERAMSEVPAALVRDGAAAQHDEVLRTPSADE